MTHKLAVIVSEARNADPARQELQRELVAGLTGWPQLEVTVVPHLYDLAPGGSAIPYLQSIPGDMIVCGWLYPRAAYWVLDAHRIMGRLGRTSFFPDEDPQAAPGSRPGGTKAAPNRTIWCLDLRAADQAGPFLEEIRRILVQTGRAVEPPQAPLPAGSGPASRVEERATFRWYPVIDYGRCTSCLECLNFCLFGVYSLDESGSILVEQPGACRNGCPACARICPAGAIMFPQHKDPAIAGDARASAAELKLDLSQLFGGAAAADLAAAERRRALAEQQRQQDAARPGRTEPPAEKDDLDRLVDGLDEMEL